MPQSTSWLGLGRLTTAVEEPTEMEVRTAEFTGVLRGVQRIDFGKLARALECTVVPLDGANDTPNFLVIPPAAHGEGDWVKYYPEDPEGEYVNLADKDVDRCHCQDFVWRGESQRTPCKHILAALVHMNHPSIQPFVAELQERNALAAAVAKECAA